MFNISCYAFVLVSIMLSFAILFAPSRINCEEQVTVNLVFFFSNECEHCKEVEEFILNPLEEMYRLEIEKVDVDETAGYERLLSMEELTGDTDNEIPAIYIEGLFFSGMEEIDHGLESMIRQIVDKREKENAEGGLIEPQEEGGSAYKTKYPPEGAVIEKTEPGEKELPGNGDMAVRELPPKKTGSKKVSKTIKVSEDGPVYAAYFYKHGCKECDRVYKDFKYLRSKYPNLMIREYDIADPNSKTLNEALCILCKVPENKRLTTPSFFVGRDYLLDDEIRVRAIESLIKKYTENPEPPPWEVAGHIQKKAENNIISRFYKFSISTVLFAGLVDGINPCAFATIIFFISYLTYVGRKGKEILFVGGAFTFAVFITYLAIGLGFFSFIQGLSFLPLISNIVYLGTGVFAFVLGLVSLRDFFICRAGKTSDMVLQLPDFLKKRIHKTIRKEAKINRYILGALAAGFIISILELACTGQVYLPTIIFVSKVSNLKLKSISYLIFYNLMFISPLCLIFITVYKGTTSQDLTAIFQKYAAPIKLFMTILFFSLGIFLIISALQSFHIF